MASQPEGTPPHEPHPEERGGGELPPEPSLPAESSAQRGSGADLLTIGLLVFFVALLVIVAALLVMPSILG